MNLAKATPHSILDTAISAETPEGIFVELHAAGFPSRCVAFVIDWCIRLVIITTLSTAMQLLGGFGVGLMLAGVFLLEWFYPVAFELSRWGATPGKQIMNLRVVMDTGLPITPAASVTRNLLRVADFMPMLFGGALVSMLLRRDGKRIGDIVAATLVVYQPKVSATATLEHIQPVAPPRALTLEEQAVLLALAARCRQLTTARVDELCALAAPLLGIAPSAQHSAEYISRQVLGVSQWLLGRRA